MNKQWLLARTPPGGLPVDEDFKWVEALMPEPGPNQMLTRTIYLSLDPYQWGRKRSGLEAVGEVCHGRTVSQVVKSNVPEYNEGASALIQKFGFTQEICRRSALERDGRRWDLYVFGLLQEEWQRRA